VVSYPGYDRLWNLDQHVNRASRKYAWFCCMDLKKYPLYTSLRGMTWRSNLQLI